jgi:hypothetical protein
VINGELKKELIDFWDRATNFYRCRCAWRRIKRFIVWFPIIWKDEDWEETYLFEIMRFKISRLRKNIEKEQHHIGWEKDVRNMKIAEELLSRHSFSDFYRENDDKNKIGCTCKPYRFRDCIKKLPGGQYSEWINPFCEWCRKKTQLRRKHKKEKEDFDYLWKLMHKESQKWWD